MINSISPNAASAITPFNPLGKQTVGEEEKDSKNSSLKAVEESAQSEKNSFRKNSEQTDAIESVLDKEEQKNSNSSKQDSSSQQAPKNDDDSNSFNASTDNDESKQGDVEQKKTAQEKRQQAQDQEEIRELAQRDREVRDHERAHAAVGGQYAGAPSFQYKRGPDGINYAVSGEVNIKVGTVNNNPQATITKAQQIRNAALAPADPSPQDRRVAANATQMEMKAREELIQERREKIEEKEEQREARLDEKQATTPPASTAPASQQSASEDERDDTSISINAETNRRIIALSQNYLAPNNPSNEIGRIVSEAV